MTYQLIYSATARKIIRKLDPSLRQTLQKALEELARYPDQGKPLSYELKGLRSWRVSDYRVIYQLKRERLEIIVVAVGHRREIYERLKQFLKA